MTHELLKHSKWFKSSRLTDLFPLLETQWVCTLSERHDLLV